MSLEVLKTLWASLDMNFVWGAVTGTAGTKGLGLLYDHVMKSRSERKKQLKELLERDLDVLIKAIDPLQQMALDYYALPSDQGAELSKKILNEFGRLGRNQKVLNTRLAEHKKKLKLDERFLISYRKAVTLSLDVQRAQPLLINSPVVNHINDSAESLSTELSRIRYSLI